MVNLSANLPLTNMEGGIVPIANQKSIMLTISKSFNVPVLYKRNYHDMKVLLYHDINSNGLMDVEDTLIKKAMLTVKGLNLIE